MSKKSLITSLFCIVILAVGTVLYTKVMARTAAGTPPPAATADKQADLIVVSKDDKQLFLLRDGAVIRTYQIAMGSNWDQGHKQQEGDERTPEGRYLIDWRNPKSVAHLSLHISYPNPADQEAAHQAGRNPGGAIMIHGLPNGWGLLGPLHHLIDWTNGCVAVTNAEMQEIWSMVPDGTPIEIYPQWQSSQSDRS